MGEFKSRGRPSPQSSLSGQGEVDVESSEVLRRKFWAGATRDAKQARRPSTTTSLTPPQLTPSQPSRNPDFLMPRNEPPHGNLTLNRGSQACGAAIPDR